jgi:branched-chain amino acid transport system substrate-binding protein
MQTIGILLPRSSFYTGLSFDMFEGFRASLRHMGADGDIRLVTENIGFGTDKQLCYKAAEQLIMHENAQIVFGYVGHRMAQVLRPLFQAANRILVVMDAGANVPQEWPDSPHIVFHSLHNSFGSWLAAKRAAKDGFTSAGMVTGYYDGGYLQTWGLTNGFENAGGRMAFNHATGYLKTDFTIQPLKEHIEQNPDSALLSIFSGDYLQWYFEGLKEIFGERELPVYLPPFAFEETMLSEAVYPGPGVKGVAAWGKELDNEANKAFIGAMEEAGREANLFSLLGWESAFLAAFLLEKLRENRNNVRTTTDQLGEFALDSPRGRIFFHMPSRTSLGPLYEASVESADSGGCRLVLGDVIPETLPEFEAFIAEPTDNAISGWYNSYTCI